MAPVQLAAVVVLVIVLSVAVVTAVAARAARRDRAILLEVERDIHLRSGIFPPRWTFDPDGAPIDAVETSRDAVLPLGYQQWTRFVATDTGMAQRVEGELYRNQDATVAVMLARVWPNTMTMFDDPRVTAMPEAIQAAISDHIKQTLEPATACTFTSLVIDDEGTTTRIVTSNAAGETLVHQGFRYTTREGLPPAHLARAHEEEIDGRETVPIPDNPEGFLEGERDLLAACLEANGWLGPPDEQGRRFFTLADWEKLTDPRRG